MMPLLARYRSAIVAVILIGVMAALFLTVSDYNKNAGLQAEVASLHIPRIVSVRPGPGEEIGLEGPIEVTFDQVMDRPSVEKAIAFSPKIAFQTEWLDDSTLWILPQRGELVPAQHITLTIGQSASSAEGWRLERHEFKLDTVGFLKVTDISPANDDDKVTLDSTIRVIFNRPVASLSPSNAGVDQPDPLIIDPPIPGHGEWTNTSIYIWKPEGPLLSGQHYTVKVSSSLRAVSGEELDSHYQWAFTTEGPSVVEITPDREDYYSGYTRQPLDTPVTILFSQPMNRASVEDAFFMKASGQDVELPGTFTWNDDGTLLTFKASQWLELGTQYLTGITDAAFAADGNSRLAAASSKSFTTVESPRVELDWPDTNSTIQPYLRANFSFNTEMDENSLYEPGRLTISPAPPEKPSISVWSYTAGTSMDIEVRLRSKTTYTITVNPGAKDIYGNVISEPYSVKFTTEAASPRIQFNTGGRIGFYDATRPTRIILATRSVPKVDLELYKLQTEDLNKITDYEFVPQSNTLIRKWSVYPSGPQDEPIIQAEYISPDGGALEPGLYYLRSPQKLARYGRYADQFIVVVNANLTYKTSFNQGMVWLTDLQTGKPLSGKPVTLYSPIATAEGDKLKPDSITITTDLDGTGTVDMRLRPGDGYEYYDYYSGYSGTNSYAVVDTSDTFAVSLSYLREGISPSDFGIGAATRSSSQTAYVYTDRPIYRPGQEIFFKGILRNRDDMLFSLPQDQTVRVSITRITDGYSSATVDTQTLTVNEMGTFSGSLELPEDAALGRYFINIESGVQRMEDQVYDYWYMNTNDVYFDVAAYRKPEFDVSLDSSSNAVIAGEDITVTLKAEFYSGGPVSDAAVKWVAKQESDSFTYSGPGRYRFNDYTRYWDYFYFSGYRTNRSIYDESYTFMDGAGRTDANGNLVITIPTDSFASRGLTALTIEAEVTDIGNQAVSGQTEVKVHQNQYYVGISSTTYWTNPGEPADYRILVVDWTGKPVGNQVVSLEVMNSSWTRERSYDEEGRPYWTWVTSMVPTGSAVTVTTNEAGEAAASIAPPSSGSFRVRATVIDLDGNSHSSSAYIWAWGSGIALVDDSQVDDQIDMVSDRGSYKPGDVASIMITSPFEGEVTALLTIEREKVISHEVVTFSGSTYRYDLSITADHAPNIFVSATLIKGVDDTNNIPSFKMGLTRLAVAPVAQTLNVTVTPESEFVEPGKTTRFQVRVADQNGSPVTAEVSLSLVDAAVLSLAEPNGIGPVEHFYKPRLLGVLTAQPLTVLVDRLLVDLIPDSYPEGRGGGGGGGPGYAMNTEVRDDFKDTAYWNATVTTAADGTAIVEVPMPDNLTIWHMDARAVTADTQVGQAEAEVRATRPLVIRPQTPRFFIAGDQAVLSATVNNNTSTDIQAIVVLDSKGLTLAGDAAQTITIPANGRSIVDWPVTVNPDVEWVDVVFSVAGGNYSDAARPEIGSASNNRMLPVIRYTVEEPVSTAGQISVEGSRTERVAVPPGLGESDGVLYVQVQYSLAAATLDSLNWLEHFPYECNEQFTSRLIPNSITLAALNDLKVSDPVLEARLREQVDVGVNTMFDRQRPNGGWGLWPDNDSTLLVTAYVLQGLVEAHRAGAEVDPAKFDRAAHYVFLHLDGSPDNQLGSSLNRQAYMVYVLVRANEITASQEDIGRQSEDRADAISKRLKERQDLAKEVIDDLYDNRGSLSLYARALLAQSIWRVNPLDLRLETIRGELVQEAIINETTVHWEEDSNDYGNWGTDTRTTAIILDTFALIWPDSPLGPNATRWLMGMRQANHWASTHETSWSLIALTDWLRVTRELTPDYSWEVRVGSKTFGGAQASPPTARDTTTVEIDLASLMANRSFTVERGTGTGRLYYSGQFVTHPDVTTVTALSKGITISRRYLDADGNSITQASVGDIVTVEVTIIASQNLNYLVVEDYYPAGFDPVDTDLLGQPLEAQKAALEASDPYGWGWGWSRFEHIELRDERALASADYLSAGTYVLHYQMRANVAGLYHVIPPTAWQFYFPDVYGRGDGMLFRILSSR